HASPSPSVKAITGFVLHGCRYLNPMLGDGLNLGDIVEGLQHAIACSQVAGNLFVESICMNLSVLPISDRGERRDAVVLQATLKRIREIRYDFALVFVAVAVAVWFVRIGRPRAASVLDGYLHTYLNPPYPAHYQPTVE